MIDNADNFKGKVDNPEYSSYIHLSRYARWLDHEGRRETWPETVNRYVKFFKEKYSDVINDEDWKEIEESILNLEVMPSMRALMTAGPALDRDNVAGFNCSYVAIDEPRAFDELMYVLLCGTGVGFSVKKKYIEKLPSVADEIKETDSTIVVADSKIGWASAFRELIAMLYAGKIPKWDMHKVRPAGARLKTFGGRASGPEPLEELFNFTVELFKKAKGRKLTSLECHDIACKIADIVVVGGVRRSALISLSDLEDDKMRVAKSGAWWEDNVQRALANNSASYEGKPDIGQFMSEWLSLYESKSGERGIFNEESAKMQAERNGRRDTTHDFGTNPCSEIILRSKQFCNLTEIVVKDDDTLETLNKKARIATIMGTLQASMTDFRYLSAKWKRNSEEEALLGVSLTGIMDNSLLSGKEDKNILADVLESLRDKCIEVNKEYANKIGINQAAAITCVKPSGTVSQLVDSASGIHPRYSDYYIRTVRADKKDPLAQFMVDEGFPHEDDMMKPNSNYVFSFPIKAPNTSVFRDDRTAIEQLELWKLYQKHWCEHKPSITVYVKEHEWMEVGNWVYQNFEWVSGVSFLPHTDHVYAQAPYQEINEQEYNKWLDKMPKDVDWNKLTEYESDDNTIASQELACTGGSCEL